jgi:hypothetical protein
MAADRTTRPLACKARYLRGWMSVNMARRAIWLHRSWLDVAWRLRSLDLGLALSGGRQEPYRRNGEYPRHNGS